MDDALDLVAEDVGAVVEGKALLWIPVAVLELDLDRTDGGGRVVELQLTAIEGEGVCYQLAAGVARVDGDEAVGAEGIAPDALRGEG